MIILPAGEYWMGSPDSDRDALNTEKPRHLVNIPSFAIGKYPITQEQYEAVMGENPSRFKNKPKNPVECVTQQKAREFCQKLSERTGKKYRLPSEAEWEYACRAGSETKYYFGDDASKLGEYAWYMDNSNSQTHPVGQKKPNKWGLYDMHGNVWERCEDEWHGNYEGAPKYGKVWNDNCSQNSTFIIRGGDWLNLPRYCRSSARLSLDYDNLIAGFRPVFSVQDSSLLHS
jgi:formylglycine-generating enzyme required for sulfatase activity